MPRRGAPAADVVEMAATLPSPPWATTSDSPTTTCSSRQAAESNGTCTTHSRSRPSRAATKSSAAVPHRHDCPRAIEGAVVAARSGMAAATRTQARRTSGPVMERVPGEMGGRLGDGCDG